MHGMIGVCIVVSELRVCERAEWDASYRMFVGVRHIDGNQTYSCKWGGNIIQNPLLPVPQFSEISNLFIIMHLIASQSQTQRVKRAVLRG